MSRKKDEKQEYIKNFVRQCRSSTGKINANSENGFVSIEAFGDPYSAMTIAERLMDKFAKKENIPFETLLESLSLLHQRNSEVSVVYIYVNPNDDFSVAKLPKRVKNIKDFVRAHQWLIWDKPEEKGPFEILIERDNNDPALHLNKFIEYVLNNGAKVKIKEVRDDNLEWIEVLNNNNNF